MHDDTDWFRGYLSGLQEAIEIIRHANRFQSIRDDAPDGFGLLVNYLDRVKAHQMPWPDVKWS